MQICKACILLGELPVINVGHPDHKREWKRLPSCSYYITAHIQFSKGCQEHKSQRETGN